MLNVDNCLPVDLVADSDIQQLLYDEMEKKGISGLEQIRELRQSKASAMLADIRKAMPTGLDLDALTDEGVAPVRNCTLVIVFVTPMFLFPFYPCVCNVYAHTTYVYGTCVCTHILLYSDAHSCS